MKNIAERLSQEYGRRTFERILEYVLEDVEFILATQDPEDQITPQTICSRREWRSLNDQQRRILRNTLCLLEAAGKIPVQLVNAHSFDV